MHRADLFLHHEIKFNQINDMMRRIINGEPVFHCHKCSPDRVGKVMTEEELHDFAVEVLMSEYDDTNSDVIKLIRKRLMKPIFVLSIREINLALLARI